MGLWQQNDLHSRSTSTSFFGFAALPQLCIQVLAMPKDDGGDFLIWHYCGTHALNKEFCPGVPKRDSFGFIFRGSRNISNWIDMYRVRDAVTLAPAIRARGTRERLRTLFSCVFI